MLTHDHSKRVHEGAEGNYYVGIQDTAAVPTCFRTVAHDIKRTHATIGVGMKATTKPSTLE